MVLSCVLDKSTKPSAKPADKTDVLTVFLTGNTLGELQPCGCSGGQLGGFDRRSAIFKSVPASKRLTIDTGLLVEETSEQSLIKFNTIIQAFSLLDYDLVNLTEKDIEIAKELGLSDSIGLLFNVIRPHRPADVNMPAKFTKKFSLKGKTIAVTVASFDVKSAQTKHIKELFAAQSDLRTVKILILNDCKGDVFDDIVKTRLVDCLVCPAESDEPRIIDHPDKKPLIQIGRASCRERV